MASWYAARLKAVVKALSTVRHGSPLEQSITKKEKGWLVSVCVHVSPHEIPCNATY